MSVKKITQETGVAIREIDFCDPQGGKRVCDRKAATIKGQMRIYGNEGHNIEDATQMKTAIESSNRLGPISDVVTVVGSVPPRIDNGECTWQGVSLLNNFEITDPGVRVWRAYLKQPGNKGTFKEMVSRMRKKEPIQASQSEHVEDNRADDGTMEEGHEGLFSALSQTARDHFST